MRPPDRPEGMNRFEFMGSEVSSEKPKGLLIAEVAGLSLPINIVPCPMGKAMCIIFSPSLGGP